MTDSKPLSNHRFLVVDDEVFSMDIVRRMLMSLGATVVGAENGEAAIEVLKAPEPVSCIITDFNMPKMNGLELLKAIRTGIAGVTREVPVVMLTGHADTDLVGTALALDASGFIVKPVSQKVLAERLERVLAEPPQIRPPLAYKVIQALTLDDILREARSEPSESPKPSKPSTPSSAPQAAPSPPVPKAKAAEEAPYRGPEVMRMIDTVMENAVLSRDVRTRNGVQLLAAGQVLTPRLIQRLRDLKKMGEPHLEVWVRSSR